MGTPIVDEIITIGTTLLVQIGIWIKDIIRFIITNFRYDKPTHLFALSLILFFTVLAFIGMFLSAGMGLGVGIGEMGSIGIGSGAVMSSTSELGELFGEDFENREDDGGGAGETDEDTDGDGTPDDEDSDIDGDGIPNIQDYDVDGDGIPNEEDSTPCGEYIDDCVIPYPVLCPNGICDIFQTPALRSYEASMANVDFCSDGFIFHDIPDYCWNGESGYDITAYVGVGPYYDAVCGTINTQERLNSRCIIEDDKIYYKETVITCPLDCNDTYDCYRDYTCDRNPDNCMVGNCCPAGTYWAGHCQSDMCILSRCNEVAGSCIYGVGWTLDELRHVPTHCECHNDADCIGDWGGEMCCVTGTYHEYFCYHNAVWCNWTGV